MIQLETRWALLSIWTSLTMLMPNTWNMEHVVVEHAVHAVHAGHIIIICWSHYSHMLVTLWSNVGHAGHILVTYWSSLMSHAGRQ